MVNAGRGGSLGSRESEEEEIRRNDETLATEEMKKGIHHKRRKEF